MYRFIFGFQRFVWCPKWTPASSSCFIEITALCPFAIPFFPPSVQGLFRRALRPSPFTPSLRGTPGRVPPVGDKLQLSRVFLSQSPRDINRGSFQQANACYDLYPEFNFT